MNEGVTKTTPIVVQLVVRDNCPMCHQVWQELEQYSRFNQELSLELLNLDKGDVAPNGKQSYLTPALWINQRLWSVGELKKTRFENYVNRLINGKSIQKD